MDRVMAAGLLAAIVILVVGAVSRRRKKPGFLALCEYWVYVPGSEVPNQQALMDRMISSNPHNRPGSPCIGAREGMLFTDIRLHVALATKAKNPIVFRPDLFQNDLLVDKEILDRLSSASSLIKIRYVSEVPLADTRHLQFLPHMAEAVSFLSQGTLVYDVVSERISKAEDFSAVLAKSGKVETADFHVRTAWTANSEDGSLQASTKGFRKIGSPELRTDPVQADMKTLVASLMDEVVKWVYAERVMEGSCNFDQYGDSFTVQVSQGTEGFLRVAIKRTRQN